MSEFKASLSPKSVALGGNADIPRSIGALSTSSSSYPRRELKLPLKIPSLNRSSRQSSTQPKLGKSAMERFLSATLRKSCVCARVNAARARSETKWGLALMNKLFQLPVLVLLTFSLHGAWAEETPASAAQAATPATAEPAAADATAPATPTEPILIGTDKINSGDTAWMLTSTALVLMMTVPGLALFYGGMVRKKNVLATLMQSFAITCVITILWWLIGYSWAFTPGSAYLGGATRALFNGMTMMKDANKLTFSL